MVDCHYIKRGKKLYGPYYYRSYRVGKKVKKEYLGKDYPKKIKIRERIKFLLRSFVLPIFLVLILFLIIYFAGMTGRATVELSSTTFKANEPLSGNLNLILKQGELIPEKTSVTVQISNETYAQERQIKLKKFVKKSGLDTEKEKGDFYVENADISGEGQGYGLEGIKIVYPFVYFKLEITGENEDGTELLEIVDGSVMYNVLFTYNIANDTEEAEIVGDSIYYYDEKGKKKELDEDALNIEVTPSQVIVTTDFYYQAEGFGSDFISESITTLALNLSALELAVEEPGNYNLTIIFSYEDKTILQTQASINIVSSNLSMNHAPYLLQTIPDQTLHANTNLSINLADYFIDPENDALIFTATQPEHITINIGNETATITPEHNWLGSALVKFNASDGRKENESNLVRIEVTNNPPVLTRNITNIEIKKNGNATFNLSWYFTDENNDLLTYSSTRPENITISIVKDTVTLTPDLNFAGKMNITFYASDNINTTASDLVVINVTVLEANHPPQQVATIPDQAIQKNNQTAIKLSDYFIDEDGNDITYNISEFSETSNLAVEISNDTATVVPDINFIGTRNLIFSASDWLATTESNIVMINVTQIEIPEENVTGPTPPEPPKENITEIITNPLEIVSEETTQQEAVINQPVEWKKQITLEDAGNTSLRIPGWASNITVKKIVNKSSIETTPILGYAIRQLARITGFAIAGDDEENNVLILEAKASFVEIINESGQKEIKIVIEDNAQQYKITYESPAPQVEEKATTSYKKTIEVFTEYADLHYSHITAYTSLPDIVPINKRYSISLYHLVNGSKEKTDFVIFDTNSNNFIDRIEWLVPSLSNQSYEVSITIINVQSYPTLYGNWTVYFNTTGEANLTITAIDGTTWTETGDCGNETCHLDFENLTCSITLLNYTWLENSADGSNNSVFYSNYSCSKEGSETSVVLIAAAHTLKFQFGLDVAYAYNSPGAPYFSINYPANTSSFTNTTVQLNATVYDADNDLMEVYIYAANNTKWLNTSLVYINSSVKNATEILYNLTALPVQPEAGVTGTKLIMHFDNRSEFGENDTSVRDFSWNENNGSVVGAKWNATGGKFAGAFEFDGKDDYMNISYDNSLNITSAITISAWIKSDTDSRYILAREGTAAAGESIEVTYPDGGETLASGSTVTLDWTASGWAGDTVYINYSNDAGASWNAASVDSISCDGGSCSAYWFTSAAWGGSQWLINITKSDDFTVTDVSDGTFTFQGGGEPPACPFFYSWNGSEYVYDTQIIYELDSKEKETLQYRTISYLNTNGKIKGIIKEEEFETSYIDQIYLEIIDTKDKSTIKTILKPINASRDLDLILESDDEYLITNYGDGVYVEFESAPLLKEGFKREIKIVAEGYYTRTGDSKNNKPIITNAYVEPKKVRPGDEMIVSADVRDGAGITLVTAEMPHEEGVDYLNLSLSDGNVYNGTWQGIWDVHDTIEKAYTTKILAENEERESYEVKIIWTDPSYNKVPYALNTKAGGEFLIINTTGIYNVTADGNINDGLWHHIVATYDGSTMSLYVDGESKATNTDYSGNLPANMGNLWIGANYSSATSANFNGTIDEVAIWNRSLLASEIASHYNLTQQKYYWRVNATNGTEENSSGTYEFRIDWTAPTVTLVGPTNESTWTESETVSFVYNVSDESDISNCTFYLNGAYDDVDYTVEKNTNQTFLEDLSDGTYNWYVKCTDTGNNVGQAASWQVTVSVTAAEAPNITFMPPTPDDGTRQVRNWIYVNVSVNTTSNNVDTCLLEWDSGGAKANETMNKIGTGTNVTCWLNKTSLTDGLAYTYRVYANDSTDTWGIGPQRSNVENSLPSKVDLIYPSDGSTTTNRTPQFNWSASTDAEGDTLTYELNISCFPSCPEDNRMVNSSDNENWTTLTSRLLYFWDDTYYYNWTVRIWDDYEVTAFNATPYTLKISSSVTLNMINGSIDLGTLSKGQSVNTTNASLMPLSIRNDGNCFIDVNISIYQDNWLWNTQQAPSTYFRYKIDNLTGEEGAFNWSGSQVNWTNIPQSNTSAIDFFNYTDATDVAEIDILAEAPINEGAGYKNATLSFTGWYVREI